MASSLRFECPQCGGAVRAPARQAGQPCICPKCGARIRVPEAPGSKPRESPRPPPPSDEEFPVICSVCSSRLLSTHDQVGQTIRCPDCFTENEIVAPRVKTRTMMPEFTDEEIDFKLSDPVERPKYEPISRPDRSGADTDDETHASSAAARDRARPITASTEAHEALAKAENELREQESLEPAESDKALLKGVFVFLRFPSTLVRLAAVSLAVALMVSFILWSIELSESDAAAQFGSVILRMICAVVLIPGTLAFGAACLLAITIDSSRGDDEIGNWPDLDFIGWLPSCIFIFLAALYAAAPGLAICSFLNFADLSPILGVVLEIISVSLLFPILLLSMLDNDSYITPYSRPVWDSLRLAADAWVLFYFESAMLVLVSTIGFGLMAANWVIMVLPASVWMTLLAFCYFRLIGRMAWICQEVTSVERERPDNET